jgi:hypothetical protein
MSFRQFQPNFSRGEMAPALYGRYDVDTWNSAVKKARNVLVLKYGGLTKRPGTRLVAEVIDDSQPNRIIPFQFSLTQTYALEMGQGYMSPCALGGRLIEEELTITAITNAVHAQITAAYHDYSAGQLVYLSGIAGELGALLNGRFWPVLASMDANNFTIDADTTGLAAFTTATGGITRVGAPAPPPSPPVVPPVVPPPDPPDIGGPCVSDDTAILLATGIEIPASHLEPGMTVTTRPELDDGSLGEWGEYEVTAISFVEEPVFRCFMVGWREPIRATARHRFWVGTEWAHAEDIGEPDGAARVAKITTTGRTYVSAGVLSHNIKFTPWFYG